MIGHIGTLRLDVLSPVGRCKAVLFMPRSTQWVVVWTDRQTRARWHWLPLWQPSAEEKIASSESDWDYIFGICI